MDFTLDEDHRLLQQGIREFAIKEVAKGAAERDQEASMPEDLRSKLAEMGLFGIAVPDQYGGAGMGCVASSLVVEEISKACAGTGVLISAHNSLCVEPILTFGTDEQKDKYLPRLASGELIGCLSLTEPGSGSDAGAATCRAELKDDGWHITGTKNFVTNGKEAGVMVLIAVTDPDEPKRRLSAFIVEKPSPGLSIGKLEKKLGIRCSSTAEFSFDDCVIPKDAPLGERGRGLRVALTTLNGGRIGIAAQALGIAQDRQASGDPDETRRHGRRDRGGAGAGVPRGVVQGHRTGLHPSGRDGQALRERNMLEGRQPCRSSFRWVRLLPGLPRRAVFA